MEKNAFRTPPRGLCGGFSFCRRPLRRCAPSVGAPLHRESPSVGGVACPGGLFAPVNGDWRLKSLRVCGSGTAFGHLGSAVRLTRGIGGFFSQKRRMFHVKQAGKMVRAAFLREKQRFLHKTTLAAPSAASLAARRLKSLRVCGSGTFFGHLGSAVRLTRGIGGFFSQERRMFHVKQARKMAQQLFHA